MAEFTPSEKDPLVDTEKPRTSEDIKGRGANSSSEVKTAAGIYGRGPGDLPPGDSPNSQGPGSAPSSDQNDFSEDQAIINLRTPSWLIQKASAIYTTATSYMDANVTDAWEQNLAHFNSQHSQRNTNSKAPKRSRLFRPKTRAMIKKSEAAVAVAAFSTEEFVQVEPQDPSNEVQRISAIITKKVLQYRLSSRMPWFQTVLGAWQDTKNYGLCITHNYWRFEVDLEIVPQFDDDGQPLMDDEGRVLGEKKPVIRVDDLTCDNVPPENIRFDPMCDWRDPANSSPYIVYLLPMYAGDVIERMTNPDTKTGAPPWIKHSLAEVLATKGDDYNRTRQAREGDRRVSSTDSANESEYQTVWAHMNIIRVSGKDFMYWTLGPSLLLSLPIPLKQAYPHLRPGERPFTIGTATIETHRNYPAGDNQQMAGIQQEINAIANQRMDNVKLVLNKRYYVRRGGQVDLDALIRNTPGGGVMMNDTEKDVKTVNTNDVTSSSYQEQDRLNVEADDITGNFSQGSVQSNRNLNETVGGMGMMQQGAGAVGDYGISVFMETWMAPTLRQFARMIHAYETDQVILSIATKQSDLWKKYSLQLVTDEILQQDLELKVDFGIGMSDPMRRVERLLFAIEKTSGLPGMVPRLKSTKLTDEIFGTLGYRDGSRFYMSDEEFEKSGAGEQPPPEVALKQQELELRKADNEARHARELQRMEMEAQLGFAKLALEKEISLTKLYETLGMEDKKVQTIRDTAAVRETNKIHELAYAAKHGKGV